MSIITFEFSDLKDYGLSRENAKEAVERLGMSLEATDEKTITIDITPNRPDLLDIVGFSRAASFLTGRKAPKEKFYTITNKPIMQVTVTKAVKRIRPYISALVAKNVDLSGNKLKNLINFTEKFCETYGRKRKKIAIGIYDFDAVKGPLTYDASKSGEFVPLGARTKMKFDDIIKTHQKGIEYSNLLAKTKAYPFLQDSRNNILSLIPIVNSENCKVTNTTKNIIVEFTGTSSNAVEEALELICCSFMDTNADIYPCEIVYTNKKLITPQLDYKTVKMRKSKVESTLGVYLEENKLVGLANKLGHVAAKYGQYTLVYAPPYRIDVLNEQDIVEDMAIAYGYDNITPIPIVSLSNSLPEESKERANKLSRLMLGMSYTEVMNPYLTNEHLNFEMISHKIENDSSIRVAYAKTEAITMLRTNLLSWLVQNLSSSTNERMPQRLFEIGSVFRFEKGSALESTNISIVNEHSRANFSEMKSVISNVLNFLEVKDYKLKEFKDSAFIEGRAAQIIVGSKTIGYFGEVHPKVLQNFKIEEPVVAAELMLSQNY